MRNLTVVVALLAGLLFVTLSGCTKAEPPNATTSEPPASPPAKEPESAGMTEAEIMAVIESAKTTKSLIEERNDKYVSLDEAGARRKLVVESDREITSTFDQAGVERFLSEHPQHEQAGFVREVRELIAFYELWFRSVEAENTLIRISALETESEKLSDTPEGQSEMARLSLEQKSLAEEASAQYTAIARDAGAMVDAATSDYVRKEAERLMGTCEARIRAAEEFLSMAAPIFAVSQFHADGGMEVTAKQLWGDFDANEIAALQKYGDGKVLVRGNISRISADFMNKPTVHLGAGARFRDVLVVGVPTEIAAALKKREDFGAVCDRVSEVGGTPICHSPCDLTWKLGKTRVCLSDEAKD